MTDHELLNQIRQSAEQIDVPASLTPDKISSKLKTTKTPSVHFRFSPVKSISAAAVLAFMGILSGITWNSVYSNSTAVTEESCFISDTADTTDMTKAPAQPASADTPKQNAGDLYTVAKSYEEIYDVINASASSYVEGYTVDSAYDIAEYDTADSDTAATGINESAAESAPAVRSEQKQAENLSSQKSFSTTNLQTEGVDESDLIKTDGSYIYTVKDRHVFITDTANGALKQTASIQPELNTADSILELYVDNNALLLLVQHYDTAFKEAPTQYYIDGDESPAGESGFLPLEDTVSDSKSVHTSNSTVLYVYDISNPADPVLQGTTTQDGFYYTSRKIGDIVYLFTQKMYASPIETQSEAKADGAIIPCINDEKISYDHIYLPKEGNNGLICSSVNIKNPQETIDDIMILYDYAEIYVSSDSIYLYRGNYQNNEALTEIAKFHIQEGNIDAVNATSVRGTVNDTFAIQEYQDNLRILTTSYDDNANTSNQLYLLDKDLKLIGSLEGIAEGEEIYAAKYFENTAYFITYRNTDPLFAADLSDPTNPKLLGELKISGFSEYLHFWGEDKLLGIGYETNAENGEFLGLKLVMFDISDPVRLTASSSLVLDQYYYSPALYNYKCVLADFNRNLLGFAAETDSSDADYMLYSWENDHFVQKLTKRLPDEVPSDYVRGIYIGDKFYIASPGEITSFDMTKDFQEISHIKLQK